MLKWYKRHAFDHKATHTTTKDIMLILIKKIREMVTFKHKKSVGPLDERIVCALLRF